MVRINLIHPRFLADQHLIAEYDEILMLLGYVKKYPYIKDIPIKYCLGKGHIKFFKNKLAYLKNRHELIKEEMRKRGFKAEISIKLNNFNKKLISNWKPTENDKKIIRKRLKEKILKKRNYYRYYRKIRKTKFLLNLVNKST